MKTINHYQCCYCKNSGANAEDFFNIQKSSFVTLFDKKKQNHITYGCQVCKNIHNNNAVIQSYAT